MLFPSFDYFQNVPVTTTLSDCKSIVKDKFNVFQMN